MVLGSPPQPLRPTILAQFCNYDIGHDISHVSLCSFVVKQVEGVEFIPFLPLQHNLIISDGGILSRLFFPLSALTQ